MRTPTALAFLAIGFLFGAGLILPEDEAWSAPDPGFKEELLAIARRYRSAGKVEDGPKWAPTLCRMPLPREQGRPRKSASEDAKTHGGKLYFLYASDREAYAEITAGAKKKPVMKAGFSIVKEAWEPKELAAGAVDARANPTRPDSEGRRFVAGAGRGLYIMFKRADKGSGTDRGWVYGTVSADGKTVTSLGKVASCVRCHVKAGPDRLFGLPAKGREMTYGS